MALNGTQIGGAAPFRNVPTATPTTPTNGPGPAGHETPTSPGLYPPGTTYSPTGGGFTGTTAQSGTAATIAGMTPNSPQWIAAVQGANANGGVLPPAPQAPQVNPFSSDPGYAGATAAETLGIPAINGALQDEIARRLAQWGDASFASQAGFGVDPQGAAFARQNYLSGNADLARLDHQHQLMRQAIINRLAGHGLLFSGDTGYLTGQEDQGYGNQVYDGQQKVLADLYGYQTSALGQKAQLHAATTAALENAFTNAAAHPGLYGDGTQPQTTTTTTKAAPKPTRSAIINSYVGGRAAKRFG